MLLSHTATLLTLYRRGKNSLQAPHRLRFTASTTRIAYDDIRQCTFLHIFSYPRCTLTNDVLSALVRGKTHQTQQNLYTSTTI